ncbi:MAG: sugar transferase [Planctomycetota bacterium]
MSAEPTPAERRGGIPRPVEVALSLVALAALSPILLLCALGVRLSSRGPILFRQERVGLLGRPFTLYKFRSMRVAAPGPQVTASGDARVTLAGRLLRSTKLDETPELWNVVKGDMSLVGPRPEVPRYVDPASPRWQEVLSTRPGLTDPVTLSLRNEETLLASITGDREEFYARVLLPYKLDGYVRYIRARTAASDVRVILATILAVLSPGRARAPTRAEIEAANARGGAP